MAARVAILLGVQEFLVSNLCPEFDCPDGGLSQFSQSVQANSGIAQMV
jgi:hypothetical protein